jgi:apolipoprotein N-acyltransferase
MAVVVLAGSSAALAGGSPKTNIDYVATFDGNLKVVNTAEFKDSAMAWQHLRRARLTALAVGSPLVRCSNGGISCVVDRFGRVVDSIKDEQGNELMVQGARVFRGPLVNSNLAYREHGDGMALMVYLALVLAAALLSRRGRVEPGPPEPSAEMSA